jgi:hypothetical protein
MDINSGVQQDSRYPAARFNEKGCLQVWGGDALRSNNSKEELYFCIGFFLYKVALINSCKKN